MTTLLIVSWTPTFHRWAVAHRVGANSGFTTSPFGNGLSSLPSSPPPPKKKLFPEISRVYGGKQQTLDRRPVTQSKSLHKNLSIQCCLIPSPFSSISPNEILNNYGGVLILRNGLRGGCKGP